MKTIVLIGAAIVVGVTATSLIHPGVGFVAAFGTYKLLDSLMSSSAPAQAPAAPASPVATSEAVPVEATPPAGPLKKGQRFCEKCGASLSPTAKFCSGCGGRVA